MKRILVTLAVLALVCSASYADVELPDTGIVISEYVDEVVASLAGAVAVIVGAIFAFLAIRKGIKWARSFA